MGCGASKAGSDVAVQAQQSAPPFPEGSAAPGSPRQRGSAALPATTALSDAPANGNTPSDSSATGGGAPSTVPSTAPSAPRNEHSNGREARSTALDSETAAAALGPLDPDVGTAPPAPPVPYRAIGAASASSRVGAQLVTDAGGAAAAAVSTASRPASSGAASCGRAVSGSGSGLARDTGVGCSGAGAAETSGAAHVAAGGGEGRHGPGCVTAAAAGVASAAPVPSEPVEVWHCAVSLSFLQRFAVDAVQPGWTTYDVLQNVVLPATAAAKCRYVDTLPPSASSTLTYFVSYAWSMPFASLVDLLTHHLHSADPEKVFCWVDVLAINQHPGGQQSRDLQDLEEAVRLARGTLVCLDPACVPFTRIWCLFEWWTTLRMRGLRHLVFLAEPSTRRRLSELYQGIDVRNAQATVASDRERILAAIGESLDLVNAQLKLLFLLEPHDTAAALDITNGGDGSGAADGALTGDNPGPRTANGAVPNMPSGGAAFAAVSHHDGSWTSEPIGRWLRLSPEDQEYRSLLLIGPVGCGKSHGAAAAFSALAAADVVATTTTGRPASPPGSGPPGAAAAPGSGSGARCRRRRPVAAHFCRSGDAASTDPLVMFRSLAFQLACQTHGSLAAFLQKRYLGLSREVVATLNRPEVAFNSLLLHPLSALFPPPPDDDAPPPPRWAAQAAAEAAAAAPDEVVLLIDGVDEAESPGGLPHQNRVLLALRDLFPQLPPRVRLLLTARPQPGHVTRCLLYKLQPRVARPSPPAATAPASAASASTPITISTTSASNCSDETPNSSLPAPPVPNHLLAMLHRLSSASGSTPFSPSEPAAAQPPVSPSRPPTASRAAQPHPHPPPPSHSPPPPSPASPSSSDALAEAYAALFASGLARLEPHQRAGVGSLLELLLASPEPPALHAVASMGLAPHLACLPGWGALFAAGRDYRLRAVHRSLLEWLRGYGDDDGASGEGSDGRQGEVGCRDGGEGGCTAMERTRTAAATVLAAAGVVVDVGRGHARLADWVVADLRGSRRPQTHSLRYAIYHMAHALAAAGVEGDGDGRTRAGTTTGNDGAACGGLAVRPQIQDRARQLDELLLDLRFWEQVYTSRLGAQVLRDLLTLPGLESPAARDVVRMIQRDHTTLERDPSLLPNLAFETPLGSATRAAAAAAATAAATTANAAINTTPTAMPAASSADAGAAAGGSAGARATAPAGTAESGAQARACTVVAPVYHAWPACLAVVPGEARGGLPASINAVRFAPGGATLAAANNAGTILVHDTQTGERVLRLCGHVDFVHDVAFVTAPRGAAAGGGGGGGDSDGGGGSGQGGGATTSAEDGCGGERGGAAVGHHRGGTPGTVLYIISAGSDRTIRVWDAVTGEQLSYLHHHQRPLTSLAVSLGGTHLASTDEDGAVCIWRMTAVLPAPAASRHASSAGAPPRIELLHGGCRHAAAAFCAAFSPDGAQLASGGKDGCVRLWGVGTGAQVAQLDVSDGTAGDDGGAGGGSALGQTPPDMVKCLAFAQDGSSLLAGLSGGNILVWRRQAPPPAPPPPAQPLAGTASRPTSPSPPRPPPTPVAGDGSESGNGGGSAGWAVAVRLVGHTSQLSGVAVAPDGRTAYSCGLDNTVRVWDLDAGSQIAVLHGHTDYALDCDVSADGRQLATAAADGTVRVWDAALAATSPAPHQHAQAIMQAAVAPRNGYVATTSKDKTTAIWALPQLRDQQQQAPAAPSPVVVPTASEPGTSGPEGPQEQLTPSLGSVATGTAAGSTGTGATPAPAPRDASEAASLLRDPDAQQATEVPLDSAGPPIAQRAEWDAGLGMAIQLSGHSSHVAAVAIAPDEVTLATGSYDRTIRVHRLDQPSRPELQLCGGHRAFVTALTFDAWGSRLVSGAADGTIAVWDAAAWQGDYFATDGAAAAAVDGGGGGSGGATGAHAASTETAAGEADGNGSGRGEGSVPPVWMSPLRTESHPELTTCWSLAASPVDYLVAGGHNGCAISIWDAMQPGQPPRQPSLLYAIYRPKTGEDGATTAAAANGHVYGVAWSPDGQRLAGGYSGHRGGRARVWDITTGEQIADIAAHDKDVWCVAFDPTDRNLLATSSYDGAAAVWDLADLRCPRRLAVLRGHRGCLRSVAIISRGTPHHAVNAATSQQQQRSSSVGANTSTAETTAMAVAGAASAERGRGPEKWLLTAGTDATVRVWSFTEAVRRQEVSYVCPWALTG